MPRKTLRTRVQPNSPGRTRAATRFGPSRLGMLALQRAVGNQAAQRVLEGATAAEPHLTRERYAALIGELGQELVDMACFIIANDMGWPNCKEREVRRTVAELEGSNAQQAFTPLIKRRAYRLLSAAWRLSVPTVSATNCHAFALNGEIFGSTEGAAPNLGEYTKVERDTPVRPLYAFFGARGNVEHSAIRRGAVFLHKFPYLPVIECEPEELADKLGYAEWGYYVKKAQALPKAEAAARSREGGAATTKAARLREETNRRLRADLERDEAERKRRGY